MSRLALLLVLAVTWLSDASRIEAGEIITLRDPRELQQQQQVIFPHAEVKVVAFELESVAHDPRGKEIAKLLHETFLKDIGDVEGGAILTYVTQSDQKIENYRATAERVAKEQKAQIVVWGTVLLDPKGVARTNIRATLIELPPGVSGPYFANAGAPGQAPIAVRGVIDAPVTQSRIDFTTVPGDISPVASFLAGLVRYYKGAVRDGAEASRWLTSSTTEFRKYIASGDAQSDASADAQAYLYIARAEVRLATADKANAAKWLGQAGDDASKAAQLNPYSAEAPTVQAVIAASTTAPLTLIRDYLTRAVMIAPLDANTRMNAAMLASAQGRFPEAMRQLDQAGAVYEINNAEIPAPILGLKEQIKARSH